MRSALKSIIRYAELGRFLNHPVHVVGAPESLDYFAFETGFSLYLFRSIDAGPDLFALENQGGRVVDCLFAVEQNECCA